MRDIKTKAKEFLVLSLVPSLLIWGAYVQSNDILYNSHFDPRGIEYLICPLLLWNVFVVCLIYVYHIKGKEE